MINKEFRALIFLLICMLCVNSSSVSAKSQYTIFEFTIGDSKLIINGNPITPLKQSPFIEKGRTMVPWFRYVAGHLGFMVDWKSDDKITIFANKKTKVEIQIDNKIAKVNDKEVQIDPPAISRDGYLFFPIRFLMESFGAKVTWNGKLHKVTIVYIDLID